MSTAPNLTQAQTSLLLAISGCSCAWETTRGWQPKKLTARRAPRKTAERLITEGLAEVKYALGRARLELTPKGEQLAADLKVTRADRKAS